MRRIWWVILGCLIVLGASAPVRAQPSGAQRELLVLEVRLGSHRLSPAMPAYQTRGERLFVPLAELCAALEFPIQVDASAAAASGWFLKPERTFSLDLVAGRVQVAERSGRVADESFWVEEGDIFIDAALLEQWFPLDFELSYSQMRLAVSAREPLPFQRRLEREKRRQRWRRHSRASGPLFEVVPTPYRLWSPPVHDIELRAALPPSTLLEPSVTGHRALSGTNAYSVRGAGDLLYMNGSWWLSGSEYSPVHEARLRLERHDPGGELLGPMRATRVAVGDLNSPRVPLLSRGFDGVGALASSFPLHRPSSFDSTSFRGELPTGWEVELYRNGALIDFQTGSAQGRYAFEEAPVGFGVNRYELVFYGPYGQRRREERSVYVGADMIQPGRGHYQVYAGLHREDLVPGVDLGPSSDQQGAPRAVAQYDYGLSQGVSLHSQAGILPLSDGQHYYAGGGVRASLAGLFGTLQVIDDIGGGWAGRAGVQTRWADWDFSAVHTQLFGDFASEEFPVRTTPLTSRTEARAMGRLPAPTGWFFPVQLGARHDVAADGRTRSRLTNRLSVMRGRFLIRHRARFECFGDADVALWARLDAMLRAPGFSVRPELVYEALPQVDIRAVGLRGTAVFGGRWNAEAAVRYELERRDNIVVSAGVNTREDWFEWGAELGWSDIAGASATLVLRTSIGPNPDGSGWRVTPRRLTSRGTVVPRVFEDRDADGRFGEGDLPVEGVRFRLDQARRAKYSTSESGRASIDDVASHRYLNLSVDRSSLANPFAMPAREGVTVVPRPAAVTRVDVPLVMAGEVEGTIYRQTPDGRRPVGKMNVELVDHRGEVVARAQSSFDGFYVLNYVKPGVYTLRIDPDQLRELGGRTANGERSVTVRGGGELVRGQNFLLRAARASRDD